MKMLYIKFFIWLLVLACSPCINCSVNVQRGPHASELISSPAHYEFHYAVHSPQTGDIKDQFEHRRGDYVTGRYSLIEPDGHRRIVDYSSDPLLGFIADVRREFP